MFKTNWLGYSGQILAQVLRNLLYFPLWWYSAGLWSLLTALHDWLTGAFKNLALGVWVKNIFVPMYGQRDFAGWAISVLMRLVQIVWRAGWFLILAVCGFALIALW